MSMNMGVLRHGRRGERGTDAGRMTVMSLGPMDVRTRTWCGQVWVRCKSGGEAIKWTLEVLLGVGGACA